MQELLGILMLVGPFVGLIILYIGLYNNSIKGIFSTITLILSIVLYGLLVVGIVGMKMNYQEKENNYEKQLKSLFLVEYQASEFINCFVQVMNGKKDDCGKMLVKYFEIKDGYVNSFKK